MSDDPIEDVMSAALLTPREMAAADRITVRNGLSEEALIDRAGAAVADVLRREYPLALSVAFLVGRGNNGADAIAAARELTTGELAITLFLLDDRPGREAAALESLRKSGARIEPLEAYDPSAFDLVVDGLLGAGLSRPVEGALAFAIRTTNTSPVPVLAIDLPSGVSGDTGAVLGEAVSADLTVTFFRRKPGHLLQPGRARCGRTLVADIGIAAAVLGDIRPATFSNEPLLWRHALRLPASTGHKFDRGHAVVFSGGASTTGAARLSAMAALRAGSGLATVFSPASALLVNASHLTAVMLKRCEDLAELQAHLGDTKLATFVLGPGFGIGDKARAFAEAVLSAGRSLVLDADGITSFQDDPAALRGHVEASGATLVLTPHSGEFKRLFPALADDQELSKCAKARAAAARSGAVVVLKGSDSVIAAPDGRAAINETGTPWLATAGSGDVLSGIIAGLLAQGMPGFEAAAAGVWMHGKAAETFGPGLIAEDLAGQLPAVFRTLRQDSPDQAKQGRCSETR